MMIIIIVWTGGLEWNRIELKPKVTICGRLKGDYLLFLFFIVRG